jgi:hypothetical protein
LIAASLHQALPNGQWRQLAEVYIGRAGGDRFTVWIRKHRNRPVIASLRDEFGTVSVCSSEGNKQVARLNLARHYGNPRNLDSVQFADGPKPQIAHEQFRGPRTWMLGPDDGGNVSGHTVTSFTIQSADFRPYRWTAGPDNT